MLAFDLLAILLSLFLSLTLRYGSLAWVDIYSRNALISLMFAALLCALPFFIRMGLYRAVLRYINSAAFLTIIRACAFSAIAFVIVDALILVNIALPRSVPFIYFTFLSILMVGSRYFVQQWLVGETITTSLQSLVHSKCSGFSSKGVRALVYGDRANVADLIRGLDRTSEYHPVAIISLNCQSHGGEINGRKVYSPSFIEHAVTKFKPQVILLAMPLLSHIERLNIINAIKGMKLPIKTVPEWENILSGRSRIQDLREINILDMLWRDQVSPHQHLLEKSIANKTVMITGAGGSIGSEIARQVIYLNASKVVLVDHSEYLLYTIEKEIKHAIEAQALQVEVDVFLVSVLDEKKMLQIFNQCPTQIVFHAAAYKHVPLIEKNIKSGVINNAFGTLIAVQCAIASSVEDFVLVSTDKAVRPTSVMGASKRLSEMILQALGAEDTFQPFEYCLDTLQIKARPKRVINNTRLSMVRFGNVLGSSGSVIPLFKQQLKEGGPLTVTAPEITRYFMSIPEAAQLVIQSAAMAVTGDIFVLDMGPPIKIKDLAARMIELSGLAIKDSSNPAGDIEIVYTGLRPGEKLFEELLIEGDAAATDHQKIYKGRELYLGWHVLKEKLHALKGVLENGDECDAIHLLQELLVYCHESTQDAQQVKIAVA